MLWSDIAARSDVMFLTPPQQRDVAKLDRNKRAKARRGVDKEDYWSDHVSVKPDILQKLCP